MHKSIILLFIVPALLAMGSCEDFWNHCVEGNGNRNSDTRNLARFDQIQVNGDFEVQLDTGQIASAVVEADDNLLGLIDTRIYGDKLIIEARNGDCLKPTDPIEITVTTPFVRSMELNGSGYLFCLGLRTNELLLRVSGSGQIECNQLQASSVTQELEGSGFINSNLVTDNFSARIEGSGGIRLSGTAGSSDLRVTGSGQILAGQFITDVCTASITGSGTMDTYVNQALDVTIVGSGILYYDGNPEITSHISGSGKIVRK